MIPKPVLALMFVSYAGSVQAQESMKLSHVPGFDRELHVLFQSVAQIDGVGRDNIEIADLGSFKAISLAGQDGKIVWHLTYDSLRVRTRTAAADWQEFSLPEAQLSWAQVHVDDRLAVGSVTRNEPTVGLTDPVGVLTGVSGLLLPATPLRRGTAWTGEMRGSLTGGLAGGDDVPDIPTLTLVTELVLDSVVERTRDTLAFITLLGKVQETSIVRVTGDDPGRFNVSGGIQGSLVWSSGWSLFVSGATRAWVAIVRDSSDRSGGAGDVVNVVKTTRYRVQP